MSLRDAEYTALRMTIASRGTLRVALLPATLLGWSAAALALLLVGTQPVGVLFPLAILVGGFEAIHALHVAVERIGRYLQVYYESRSDGPQWESTAMAVGPALPGGGIDPLFTLVFLLATFANLIPAAAARPTGVEVAVIGLAHAAFGFRVLRARIAAARQRAVELESFRALQSR